MLYQKIDLGSGWQEIQNFILNKVVPYEPKNLQSRLFGVNDKEFMALVYRVLKDPLASYGFPNRIPKGAILFGSDPAKSYGIHIDGYSLERKNASNFALNIPIQNCEQGYMNWYGGEHTLSETKTAEGLGLLKIHWNCDPEIIEQTIIDVPTIVKVNLPHNVENRHPDKHRLMLSIRFTPDLVLPTPLTPDN